MGSGAQVPLRNGAKENKGHTPFDLISFFFLAGLNTSMFKNEKETPLAAKIMTSPWCEGSVLGDAGSWFPPSCAQQIEGSDSVPLLSSG